MVPLYTFVKNEKKKRKERKENVKATLGLKNSLTKVTPHLGNFGLGDDFFIMLIPIIPSISRTFDLRDYFFFRL